MTDTRPSLFDEDFEVQVSKQRPAPLETRVRSNDPDSSWEAAAGITVAENESLKDTIVRILRAEGPLTDDALYEAYLVDHRSRTKRTPRTAQRVRTARAELCRTRDPRTQIEHSARVQLADGLGTSDHGGDSRRWEAIA